MGFTGLFKILAKLLREKTHFGLSKLQKATNALQTLSYLLYENKQNVMYIFLYFLFNKRCRPRFIYLIKYVSSQTPHFFSAFFVVLFFLFFLFFYLFKVGMVLFEWFLILLNECHTPMIDLQVCELPRDVR